MARPARGCSHRREAVLARHAWPLQDVDEAVEIANHSVFGLGGHVQGADLAQARAVAQSYLQARRKLGFPLAAPDLRDEVLAKLEAAE